MLPANVTETLLDTGKLVLTTTRPMSHAERTYFESAARQRAEWEANEAARLRRNEIARRQAPHFGTPQAGLITNTDRQHWNEISFEGWAPTREAMQSLMDAYTAKHSGLFVQWSRIVESNLGGFAASGVREWQA